MAQGTSSLSKRQRPEYAAEKIDGDLPADAVGSREGTRVDPGFTEAMLVAQSDPNVWYCVATYKSDNGAKTMVRRINLPQEDNKRVPIPKGDWEMETRRVKAPSGDKKWSKLYAKFLG